MESEGGEGGRGRVDEGGGRRFEGKDGELEGKGEGKE